MQLEPKTEEEDGSLPYSYLLRVTMLFLALSVLFFFPLILEMSNSLLVPGFGGTLFGTLSRDKYHFIWNFWWLRYALSAHLDLLHTQLMFYPQGASLALQTIDFLDAALAAPFSLASTEIFSFNLVTLSSFPIAGVTAFLLAWHLTHSRLASVIGGFVYAFFPQHAAQAVFGHPNIANVGWFPAYFLALMLTFEKGKARYAVISGVILAALILIDLQELVMAAIGTLVYLVYHLIASRPSNLLRFLSLAFLVAAVGIGITSPYLFSAYGAAVSGSRAAPPISQVVANSAIPRLYLTPSPFNALYGDSFSSSYQGLTGGPANWMIFAGWTVLALAAIGAVASKERRKYYLVAIVVVFFLFSLGPSENPSTISVQSLYTLLYDHISILHYFRSTARFSIMVMLGLSCLASLGVRQILEIARRRRFRLSAEKVVALIFIALILVEYMPVVAVDPVVSSNAYSIISRDSDNFAILELPATITQAQLALYEQTFHAKPLVNGKTSQSPETLPDYAYSQPFLRSLVSPLRFLRFPHDIVNQSFTDIQLAPIVMTQYRIKYVILHVQSFGDPKVYRGTYTKLYRALGPPVFQDRETVLFELGLRVSLPSILRMAMTSPLVVFGEGWGPPNAEGRSATADAQLFVYTSAAGDYDIKMASSDRGLCLVANLSSSPVCGVYDQATGRSLYRVPLRVGRNVVSLVTAGDRVTISYIEVRDESH